jgi:hypothetical protein
MTQQEVKMDIAKSYITRVGGFSEYCEFADENGYDIPMENDANELVEIFGDADALVRAICYGDYKYIDRYVIVNAYGNLDSSPYWDSLVYLDDNFYEWLLENKASDINQEFEDEIKDSCLQYLKEQYNVTNEVMVDKLENFIDDYNLSIDDDFDDVYNAFQDEMNEEDEE